MKRKMITAVLLVLLSLSACSFYEGYVSKGGEALKVYEAPEALQALIKAPNESITIIDVRPSSAYLDGHIPTAKSFPSGDIMSRLGELPPDRSYIIYCETGLRAQMVIGRLEKKGYTKLMNWGGYKRWPYPLVK